MIKSFSKFKTKKSAVFRAVIDVEWSPESLFWLVARSLCVVPFFMIYIIESLDIRGLCS